MSEWISVKDRLPNYDTWVIGYTHDQFGSHVEYVDYQTNENRVSTKKAICWWEDTDGCQIEVTHWMPLPEPPEESRA